MITFYLIWIPCEIVVVILSGWLSYKNNQDPRFTVPLYLMGLIQVWVFVSKYSKNLAFDTILYDSIMATGYVLTIAYLTKIEFKLVNYMGFLLVIVGLILFRKNVT